MTLIEWAIDFVLTAILGVFSLFRTAIATIGATWSIIVSLIVVTLLVRFILIPLFGRSVNLGVSDTVSRIRARSIKNQAQSRKKGD